MRNQEPAVSVFTSDTIDRSHVLRPFDVNEALSTSEAAEMAGVAPRTMRDLCKMNPIGRVVLGHWKVSRPALQMLLNGDEMALAAYAKGNRSSALVLAYFRASSIPDRG